MALQFLHPHIETIINDNSEVYEEAVGGGTALFQPFISDKGTDNKIIKYTSLSQFMMENGSPNFRKHGQSIYNIVNWLKAGGTVYGVRLMPDDAALANMIVSVKVKEEDGKLKIANCIDSIDNLTDTNSLLSRMKELSDGTVDVDGYVKYPLYAFTATGRGEYGNDFSIRINHGQALARQYNFPVYTLSVIQTDEKGNMREVEGPFSVSTYIDAKSNSGSNMFLTNVLETYSDYLKVVYNEDAYDELLKVLKDKCPEGTVPYEIDFLFGRDFNTFQPYENIILDTDNSDGSLEKYKGALLVGGNDGSFDYDGNKVDRQTKINEELKKIYSCITIPDIKNTKAYPFDVMLDANYSDDIKLEMHTFASEVRQDLINILDTGLLNSVEETLEWRKSVNIDSLYTAIYGQNLVVHDGYTNSDINVTATYFLASLIPSVDSKEGRQFPVAGPNRGRITGFKSNSLSFNPNEYEQEDLYIARINYILTDVEGTEFSTNLTSQTKNTAMTNINNVRTLMRIIRQIELRSKAYKFEFSDSNTLSYFSAALKTIETEWTSNRACTALSISPYQTSYDIEQKTCRVKVDITFTGVIERIVVEVNIGK